ETHTNSFGLDPAATIFIDDAPVNVEGAKAYGCNAVLFSGPEKLRSDLAAYGLKF
ncbi:HAD-IA family hydrolase, partial [Rhizobium leguminosarum]|uniref:HAD-IA family hydrolase n=1 Tax=Rhizobium leguminosarum TaxID=384 RepID=UPI003F9C0BAA